MLPISRPAGSLDSKAALPPKASAPQADGTAEGSSSSGAVSGIKPEEAKLAGYLLARATMNQKVEGPVLKNLRAGHESVQQVNELLPLGRANVIQDVEKAKGWCKEKLAILREDSHFARLDKDGMAGHLKHDDPLNHVTGPEALKTTEKYKAQIENSPHFQDSFKKEFDRLVHGKEEWPIESFWNDTSAFHADFRGQAGKALHKNAKKDAEKPSPTPDADSVWEQAKRASIAEIQAVGVARSLGSNIRGAKAEASGIIASAKEMFPSSVSEGN